MYTSIGFWTAEWTMWRSCHWSVALIGSPYPLGKGAMVFSSPAAKKGPLP
jgi:hypothetical protein